MSEAIDNKARAGEYVLGLLDESQAAEAERTYNTDPSFRQHVDALRAHMMPLDMTAEPDAVPDGMWARIAGQLSDLPQERPDPLTPPWQASLSRGPSNRWRQVALAASLVLGLGVGYAGGWFANNTPAPVVLVVLDTQQNTPGAIFEAYADNSVRIVPLQDFEVPPGQIMQVWTLYDQNVGPVSLGTLPKAEVAMLRGQNFPTPAPDQLYEITLEPSPGSPTGKPTGPILVKGFAKQPPH